jgi:hypothetical protein
MGRRILSDIALRREQSIRCMAHASGHSGDRAIVFVGRKRVRWVRSEGRSGPPTGRRDVRSGRRPSPFRLRAARPGEGLPDMVSASEQSAGCGQSHWPQSPSAGRQLHPRMDDARVFPPSTMGETTCPMRPLRSAQRSNIQTPKRPTPQRKTHNSQPSTHNPHPTTHPVTPPGDGGRRR